MCTIITANSTIDRFKLIDQIRSDSVGNSDGFACLMILDNAMPVFMRTLDVEPICQLIMALDYSRVFIHTRFATQGSVNLENTHGWNNGGQYVFHNGSIQSFTGKQFDVDSMAIRHWLEFDGVDGTIDRLINEPFANVFIVDIDEGNYIVHRSRAGSLFTDGNGNYSTNPFAEISMPVDPYTLEQFDLDVQNTVDRWSMNDWSTEYSSLDDWDAPWIKRTGTK